MNVEAFIRSGVVRDPLIACPTLVEADTNYCEAVLAPTQAALETGVMDVIILLPLLLTVRSTPDGECWVIF